MAAPDQLMVCKLPDIGSVTKLASLMPQPPADAVRHDGSGDQLGPYKNGGYVLDHGDTRWRYDNAGLMAFLVYRDRQASGTGHRAWPPWSEAWFRANGTSL